MDVRVGHIRLLMELALNFVRLPLLVVGRVCRRDLWHYDSCLKDSQSSNFIHSHKSRLLRILAASTWVIFIE
jgi:hypothetical protein